MQKACRTRMRPGNGWGVGMGFSQRLEMRQGQSLVMTPQLLQAIKLLQLSHLDLAAYVDAELERNPLLERAEDEPERRDGPDPEDRGDRDGSDPDAFDPVSGSEASAEGPTVDQHFTDDRRDSRADLEGDLDTSFDNVFQAEIGERKAPDGADTAPLSLSPFTGVGAAVVRRDRALVGAVVRFGVVEQRVPLELGLDVGGKIDVGQLEQLDGLQQLRRHHQGLALA